MFITHRITDSKRHTRGFVIDGRIYSRHATVGLVAKQQVQFAHGKKNTEICVRKYRHGKHIATYRFAATRLYDLPILVDNR
jgi:hypothetical protein